MTIKVGEKLPDTSFRIKVDGTQKQITTGEIFSGKKAVLFAVPGAFTPTCSNNHLPGFLENAEAIKAKGIDLIAVVAVNDVHVMTAWAEANHNNGRLVFLSDGSGDFAKAVGFASDMVGMGIRSKRYSMIVEDGTVARLNVEEVGGKAEISGAARILEQLSG